MMDYNQVNEYLTKLDGVGCTKPFDEKLLVFSYDDEMFAILVEDSSPVKISLRCDPLLAKNLREKYIEVMPGQKLDSRVWNSLVLSGQLSEEEVLALIDHAYQQVNPN
jgi:predicted DNA-binding protein (MmcQ/YjbR family)